MDSKRDLFKPMQGAKTLLRETFMRYRADGHEPTDEEMKPTNTDHNEFERNPQNTLTLCKLLSFLSYEQSEACLDSNSPTSLEAALVAEINSFEQRCRHQLPLKLRNVKYDTVESLDIQPSVAKCLFAKLVALESTMQQIYVKTKKKEKKDRKKERKASQPEASVEPENQGEANDGLDNEDVVTEQANVELENQGEANDGLDEEDVASVEPENQAEDIVESGLIKELGNPVKLCQKSNGVCDDHLIQKGDSYITLTGQRAGEAAIVYEHGADIEALMPKLRHSDYYTEPRIQELAAKERAEPGFCHHVKDFVVGRHGFGSIKFLGETDVRRLDLESLIQFNQREVIVYMDESKKPPVGQGLNKPAVVTLLNIKCFDKKTGCHYTEGPRIDKYKDMLSKKAEDQGADFVSYDPIKGEWKFKVNHFSEYVLGDEDD